MKTRNLIFALILLFSLGMFGCNSGNPVGSHDSNSEDSWEIIKATVFSLPVEDLSDEEIASLLFMREEEKLARDVYLTLNAKYGLRVFDNISLSEQKHMNAVKLLIDKYSIEDSIQTDVIGVFVNQDLQALYNQLIERGNVSEIEALNVGAAIEEIDIMDLVKQIDEIVDNQDIEYVYENLKRGSENHLRAFVKNLSVRGVAYSPVYLNLDTYNSIIYN